ncbi:MAG: hypothetical protein JXA66_08200 [Oligoflexia bacterium]|nr:hypothetical protein [Oligoflexia bacterium]
MALDLKTLKKFIELAGKELEGEWVIIGGTVLPLMGIDTRSTVDIDIISLDENQINQNLKLMTIAEKLGLPIETINQAGAFFLFKIKEFRKHLIVLHKTANATVYRPDLELFIKLKIGRLSDADLTDCEEYIKYSKKHNEQINKKAVAAAIKGQVSKTKSGEKLKRLKKLSDLIPG